MVDVDGDRRRLRVAFESAADLYQQARPGYPEQLFFALVEIGGLEVVAIRVAVAWTGIAGVPPTVRQVRSGRVAERLGLWTT
jgi:hypothetical protein